MIDLLLLNGFVITMDDQRRVIECGAVGVNKGKIVFVGPTEEADIRFDAAKRIDCQNQIIMPGFVDVHSHGGHALIRGAIFDSSHWMAAFTHLYNHYVEDDYWYYEGRVNALDHLRAGITTTVSITGAQQRCDDPIFSINQAKAYAEAGLRAVICNGPCQPPFPHKFSRIINGNRIIKEVSHQEMVDCMETILQEIHGSHNDRIRSFVSPYGVLTSTSASSPTQADQLSGGLTDLDHHHLREMWRVADKYNTRIHAEVYGGSIHQMSKDMDYALFGPRVHLQHASGCSFDELQLIADTGTFMGVTFQSTTALIPMMWLGVTVAIATDGPKLLGNADMFQAMRMTQLKHKDELLFSTNGMFNLPAHKLLEMTTIDAAKVIGWDEEIGSLELGKKADIITVDLMNSRMMPRFNVIDTLVMLGNGNDIRHVFVDGIQLMDDGECCQIDEIRVLQEGQDMAIESLKRIGFDQFMHQEPAWGMVRKYETKPKFNLSWQREDGGYY